jgi:hypothetical protein
MYLFAARQRVDNGLIHANNKTKQNPLSTRKGGNGFFFVFWFEEAQPNEK